MLGGEARRHPFAPTPFHQRTRRQHPTRPWRVDLGIDQARVASFGDIVVADLKKALARPAENGWELVFSRSGQELRIVTR